MSLKQFPFLQTGGEMGDLTRAFDWSKTAIGPADGWSAALRAQVQMMLTSRFPMLIFWGVELVTFYNDAFRPSLGDDGKHPGSLGQRGDESWAESWHVIGPMIRNIMKGGDAVWFEDQKLPIYREGEMGYAYWTYSFSPLADDDGTVGGVLVTCSETTKAVESLEALQESNEELAFAIDATELGVWDYNPKTGDFAANDRLKSWFGLEPKERVSLNLALEMIVPEDRERVGKSIQNALLPDSGGRYEEEYGIFFPGGTGQRRIVQAKGRAHFTTEGEATRLNGTLRDITEQRQSDAAIREEQERFQNLMRESSVGIIILDGRDFVVKAVNDAYARLIEHPVSALANKALFSVIPDAEATFRPLLQNVLDSGEPLVLTGANYSVKGEDGQQVGGYIDVVYQPYREADGRITGVIAMITDVTAQIEARQQLEASEARFRSLIEESPVASCLFLGRGMNVAVANQQIIDIWGKGQEVVGKNLVDILPELKGQPFLRILDEVYVSGKQFEGKATPATHVISGKEITRHFDFVYKPVRDDSGEVYGVMCVAIDVTDSVMARRTVEQSEAKFRSLIAEAPFATALYVGEDLLIDTANDAMLRVWGKSADVRGMQLAEALPELEGQPFLGLLQEVLRTGIPYEAKEQSADLVIEGQLRRSWFNFTYKPLLDETGTPYAILNMAVDVSAQVEARRGLEESALFNRSVIANSPVAKIVYRGEDLRVDVVNALMLEILGKDEAIVGKAFEEALTEPAMGPIHDRIRRVYATGKTLYLSEQPHSYKRGAKTVNAYFNKTYKALRDTQGVIYGVIVTATDVTEQVEARHGVEQARRSLDEAIDIAQLGTWSLDLVAQQVNFSPRVAEWFGIPSGSSFETIFGVMPAADARRVRAVITGLQGEAETSEIDIEHQLTNPVTGKMRIIHSRGHVVRDETGKALEIIGTGRDVTMERELQAALESEVQLRTEELAAAVEELRATNEELAERTEELASAIEEITATNEELSESNAALAHSNDELAQYAYVASHDLQEPLRKIQVFSGMLGGHKDLPETSKVFVDKIRNSAERMSLLIRDLLDFSRLLKSEALMRPVPLQNIVQSVWEDFELLTTERGATINMQPLPQIEGVQLQMNQLFYNLISNGLKFTAPDMVPSISVVSEIASPDLVRAHISKPLRFAQYYHITVRDNGIGFDAQYAEQIFEVFKRLHGRDSYPGSGIGLALCRRIVGNHQGEMFAESEPGKGSTFHILLPDRQSDAVSEFGEEHTVFPASE